MQHLSQELILKLPTGKFYHVWIISGYQKERRSDHLSVNFMEIHKAKL